MKASQKRSRKILGIRLSLQEHEQVIRDMSNTTCRSLSQYGRKMILGKPVTVYYRDQAYDHFTETYTSFKRDLDVILEKVPFTEMEKKWLNEEIKIIKTTVVQLYDHVRENRNDTKPS